MMYTSKLVVAVKVNGNVLREDGDFVTLPFGCEYSIFVKNLNSVRAQVSIAVDGQDATEGRRLIVGPNTGIELERFIRNGNLSSGNRFKFIERTAAVEAHRGVGGEDGLIRVEGWREHIYKPVVRMTTTVVEDCAFGEEQSRSSFRSFDSSPTMDSASGIRGSSLRPASVGGILRGAVSRSSSMPQAKGPARRTVSDVGITVPGSQSNQQFSGVMGFPLEAESAVIVLRLRGELNGVTIPVPVTVSHKPECSTCGKKNQANSQFCSQCGTALSII